MLKPSIRTNIMAGLAVILVIVTIILYGPSWSRPKAILLATTLSEKQGTEITAALVVHKMYGGSDTPISPSPTVTATVSTSPSSTPSTSPSPCPTAESPVITSEEIPATVEEFLTRDGYITIDTLDCMSFNSKGSMSVTIYKKDGSVDIDDLYDASGEDPGSSLSDVIMGENSEGIDTWIDVKQNYSWIFTYLDKDCKQQALKYAVNNETWLHFTSKGMLYQTVKPNSLTGYSIHPCSGSLDLTYVYSTLPCKRCSGTKTAYPGSITVL